MENLKHIFIICGEASGDLHASNLAAELKKIDPSIKISGAGGALLENTGANLYANIKDFAVMGLFDVLKKLPQFFALKKLLIEKIRSEAPDALVLIDFSGFNLRLAKAVNKSLPVIYYISPQVWASRPGRIQTIKKYIDKMIVIYEFEKKFYAKHGIDAQYVGNPLLDIVKVQQIKQNNPIVALLPGSRKQEITYILPVMLETSRLIKEKIPDASFLIAKPVNLDESIYTEAINKYKLDVQIISGKTYDCINAASFCLVASGTATLETAILEKPFVAIYKMSLLNYLFYRPQVKIPFICIVNIIAGKKIIPEFIQFHAKAKKIAGEVVKTLTDHQYYRQIKENLVSFKALLGKTGASQRAAEIILNTVRMGNE
ncbi:MAG: lipid-A-disaccharide synthase [Candidatus Omnitrophica bacterium]|jgi:lipid-A-disaccharide synthase|nr:lipid-A-disaccharide synthase [Candidatus Omnitrophota bacterium]